MKRLSLFLLFLAAAVFIGAIVHLFQMRFASGDVFPRYSSLRSDPLGTKALFDTLDQVIVARRHLDPLHTPTDGRNTTLLRLGTTLEKLELMPAQLRELEQFITTGGRWVVSFAPIHSQSGLPSPAASQTSTNQTQPVRNTDIPPTQANESGEETTDAEAKTNDPAAADPAPSARISVASRWDFDYGFEALAKIGDDYMPASASLRTDDGLPQRIQLRTALHFKALSPSWRVVYGRSKDAPVIMERRFGEGTVVLCADSFLLSNEALLMERESALISWLVGSATLALFDETHLGVAETPGIVSLIRKYRLHGAVAALMLLALLFAWRNSVSFLPPRDREEAESAAVQGRESASGFINVLRRNISAGEILGTCLAEWQNSRGHGTPAGKLREVQRIMDMENERAPKDRRPLEAYRTINRVLTRHQGTKKS